MACLSSLHWKVYSKCLEKRYRKINAPKLEDIQCSICSSSSTTSQVKFSLSSKFEKSHEYASDVYTCFVGLYIVDVPFCIMNWLFITLNYSTACACFLESTCYHTKEIHVCMLDCSCIDCVCWPHFHTSKFQAEVWEPCFQRVSFLPHMQYKFCKYFLLLIRNLL